MLVVGLWVPVCFLMEVEVAMRVVMRLSKRPAGDALT